MNTEELLGSEYDNVSDLLGSDLGAVLTAVSRLPKEQHAPVLKKIFSDGDASEADSSRKELQRRWRQLPKEIRDGLLKQRLQLADTRLYIVKPIAAKNMIDQIQGTDQKNVGLANLANGKLEKDTWFLLSGLRLTYGVNADGMEKCDFGAIPPEIRNGEFELECGNKKLIALMHNDAFETAGRTDMQIGYYKLESVKVLEPQVEIKMPIKFTAAAAANSFLKVVFVGTSVIPF